MFQSPIHILHLEDDKNDQELVQQQLEASSFSFCVKHAGTREEFKEYLNSASIDIILSDFRLPGYDGLAALEDAKTKNPDIPFIFISGTMGEEIAIDSLQKGATDYILKDRMARLIPSIIRALNEAEETKRRKQAEETLKKSEELYRNLIANLGEGVCEVDDDDRFIYANPAAEAIFKVPSGGLVGRAFTEFVSPRYCDTVNYQTENRKKGNKGSYEIEITCTGSDKRLLGIMATPRFDSENNFIGSLAIISDITEQRSLEEQLRQAQKMESIGRLAGGVAHDFNNALMAIIGHAEHIVIKHKPEEVLKNEILSIVSAGERAAQLTRQLLAFSRKQMLEMEILNINDIVKSVETMLRRLIGEDIDVSVVLDPMLDNVKADASQIEQVLMNLAVNARDAMREGGNLTIQTENVLLDIDYANNHPGTVSGPHIMLSVSDTGHGMDVETINKIFEPFFTTKEHGKGTGLGLATVYGIIKQHGGSIWVDSEPGVGSTFRVYIPANGGMKKRSAMQAEKQAPHHGNETILVVEDDAMVRTLLCRVLTDHGFNVIEAQDGRDALKVSSEFGERIHLLLTDIIMPLMDGKELYTRLIASRPDIEAIFMSGYTDDIMPYHGLNEKKVHFLQKPMSIISLTQKVREALEASPETAITL
jgi:two-component system, cell cycle sensor histidine kinase and response regulator CckA